MGKTPDPDAVRRRTALKLAEVSWREFDRRRSYEWKVNFALWPALGALSGFLWKNQVNLGKVPALLISLCLMVIAYTYWFIWSLGLSESNRLNQKTAQYYWARADGDTSSDAPFPREKIYDDLFRLRAGRSWIETLKAGCGVLRIWAHGSEIIIKLILIFVAIAGALHSVAW